MSVFTHGVTEKGKPRMIINNQVFPVAERRRVPEAGLASAGLGTPRHPASAVVAAQHAAPQLGYTSPTKCKHRRMLPLFNAGKFRFLYRFPGISYLGLRT
jgi:hypothetical protein